MKIKGRKYFVLGIVILLLLLLSNILYGQPEEPGFRLIVLKGKIDWSRKDSLQYVYPIKIWMQILPNSELYISPGSVCLILKSTKDSYLELENKTSVRTNHDLDLILKNWTVQSTKISKDLIEKSDFISKEIFLSKSRSITNLYSCMKPAPHRDRCPPHVRLIIPMNKNEVIVYKKEQIFQWSEDSIKDCSFNVSLVNYFDEKLFQKETYNRTIQLALDFYVEKNIILKVSQPCQCCGQEDEIRLIGLNSEEKKKLEKRLEPLSSLNYWQLLLAAMIYEENQLYFDAFTQYKNILKLYPDYSSTDFLFARFLERSEAAIPSIDKKTGIGLRLNER